MSFKRSAWFGTPPNINVLGDHNPKVSLEGKQKIEQLFSALGYEATANSFK